MYSPSRGLFRDSSSLQQVVELIFTGRSFHRLFQSTAGGKVDISPARDSYM
jgi:hypothetical protein